MFDFVDTLTPWLCLLTIVIGSLMIGCGILLGKAFRATDDEDDN